MLRCLFLAIFLPSLTATADVPVPPRMLDPKTAVEAWNVINIAMANVERLVRDKRALEISNQISLCSPALRTLNRSAVKPEAAPLLDEQTSQAFRLINIITQNSMVGNIGAMPALLENLKKVIAALEKGFDSATIHAELFHCLKHPDNVSSEAVAECTRCEGPLVPRRIPYSFIHARADKPTIRLSLETDPAPEVGEIIRLRLHLQHADESPVLEADLWPMHTEMGQVLITGPDLSEFHHLTLVEGRVPGHYVCEFRPVQAGKHRVRVGLTPYSTGLLEFHAIDLEIGGASVTSENKRPPSESLSSIVDEGQFHFSVGGTKGRQLRAGELQLLHLQVLDAEGQPVKTLEPFRNAFAHITAFYTESDTILQLHPEGGDILQDDLRGGPSLAFKIYSPHAGLLRLFCEVQLDGKKVLAPFLIRVME